MYYSKITILASEMLGKHILKFVPFTHISHYSKSTVESCKSYGTGHIGYMQCNTSKNLAKNLFSFSYTYFPKS